MSEYEELISAAEYAATLIGKIPAFGESLGNEVNKPLLGVARNRLIEALAGIHIKEPEPSLESLIGPSKPHCNCSEWD